MKLALAQMMMSTRIEENLKKTLHLIHEAAERGADLICFPEIQLSPFFPQYEGLDVSRYLLQEEHVTKLVERHLATVKDVGHQVLLAAKETVAHVVLVLPHAAHGALHAQRVGNLTNLLKLIDAHHNIDISL